jgi:hypothetical protein
MYQTANGDEQVGVVVVGVVVGVVGVGVVVGVLGVAAAAAAEGEEEVHRVFTLANAWTLPLAIH